VSKGGKFCIVLMDSACGMCTGDSALVAVRFASVRELAVAPQSWWLLLLYLMQAPMVHGHISP